MIALNFIAFILLFHTTHCWFNFYNWSNFFDDSNHPWYDDPDFLTAETITAKSYSPLTQALQLSYVPKCVTVNGPFAESQELCPEEESSWTRNDIVDMIHYVEGQLNVTETNNVVYYKQAKELRDKYVKKFEDFITDFEDRPNHVMHILEIIADTRQRIEPSVEDVYVKLQKYLTHAEQFHIVSDRANKTFDLLDKYKEICQLNCEISGVVTRPKIEEKDTELILRNTDSTTRYCFKLRHIYGAIYDRLLQYKENNEEMIREKLKHGDNMYNERFENLKRRLKDIAIVKFGTTMYDLLSLQDDYYHFGKYVKSNNVTEELESIKKNNLDIEHQLIDLDMDLEIYRKFCANCDRRKQNRQAIPLTWRQSYRKLLPDFDIIDELIHSESNVKKKGVNDDSMRLFDELEVKLHNRDAINSYVEGLTPIQQEITHAIENEESNLIKLKDKIPSSSIAEITNLLKKTQDLLDKLLAAKNYISHFI